jgi:hypothetical protein
MMGGFPRFSFLGIFSPEVCSVNMQLALHLQDKVLIRNEPILIKNTREDLASLLYVRSYSCKLQAPQGGNDAYLMSSGNQHMPINRALTD